MGICNLDQNKGLAKSLATYLNISIKENLKGDEPFKLLGVMNKVYDIAYKKDQDTNKALGIAGAMPKLFLELLKKKPEYILQLTDKGFMMDPIIAFNKEINTSEKPLEVVGKLIKGSTAPTVAQAMQNSISVEPVGKIQKTHTGAPVYNDRELLGDTLQATSLSTVVKEKVGIYEMDQNDPDKVVTQSTVGQLLMNQGRNNSFDNVEYDGHKGFRLRGVIEGSLPHPEKNVYSANKASTTVVLAITDNEGNFLYFDENGKITTAEKGKIAYQPLRVADDTSIDKMVKASMAKAEPALREATKGDEVEFARLQRIQEIAFRKDFTAEAKYINELKSKVKANEKVLVNITGGKIGSIDDKNTKITLGEMNLDPKELASIEISGKFPVIKFRNYDQPVTLKGLKVKESSPELLKSLIDLLVDDLVKPDDTIVSPQEKIELFKQYIQIFSKGKELVLSLGDNQVNIFIGGKFISLEDKAQAKKEFTEFLNNNAYHTYIKNKSNTYNSFTIDEGVLKVKEEPSYKEFISKYLVPRIMVDIKSKRPMVNNGNLTFAPINEVETTEAEVKETLKKANEELKKSNYDAEELPDLMERSKLIASRSNKAQEEAADQWIADAAILKVKVDGKPVLTTADARNIVNSDAFATFARATMTLYKGGNSTHMYHEAWHAFSQVYLKKADRDKLYKDASKLDVAFTYIKKVPGPGGNTTKKVTVKLNTLNPNSKADRLILEEFIAEEFRMYAMNGGKFKTQDKKALTFKSLFKKIWELLKALFKGTIPVDVYSNPGSDVFSEMFDALYNAKEASDLNMFQPGIQNAEFGTMNSGIINQLSELDLDLISRSMDGIISETVTKYLTKKEPVLGAAMMIFNPKNLDNLYNVIIKKRLDERLKELLANKATNESKWNLIEESYHLNDINILTKALEQFGDVKTVLNSKTASNSVTAYHLKNSAFSSRIREASIDPTDKSETNSTSVMEQNDKEANSHESEKLATASALYIMQSLVQQEYNADKTEVRTKLNSLGFPETIEFKPFWNFIMNKVGGEQNEEDLYNKLVEIKNKKITPLVDQLLQKVGNPATVMTANKIAADIWLGLVRSMNLTRIDFHNNIFNIGTEEDEAGETIETLAGLSGKVSADYFNIRNNIWKNKFNLETGPFVKVNPVSKQNELNLDAIAQKFLTDPNNHKERYLDKDLVVEYRLKPGQDPIAFFNAIGLYLSDDYEIRDSIKPEAIDYIANAIGQASFNQITISDPVKFLNTARVMNVQKLVGEKLATIQGWKMGSNATRVNELAMLEADYSTEYGSQMKNLPSGDKKSIWSLNSTTTRTLSAINKASDISELDQIDSDYGIVPQFIYTKNPKVMGSIYKSSLFEGTGAKLKNREILIRELVGTQVKSEDGTTEGISHGEMIRSEKFVSDIQSMLTTGFIEAVRAGEKNTYVGMRPNVIVTLNNYAKKSDHLFFDTEHFLVDKNGLSITGIRVDDYLSQVMHKKLEGELRVIQKLNNGITEKEATDLGLTPEDAKDFYKNNVKGFENGFKFDWFDDVLESAEHGNKLKEALINLYSTQLTTNNTLTDLLVGTEEGKTLKRNIDAQIKIYFKNLADRFKTHDYAKIYGDNIPEFLKSIVTKNLNEVEKSKVTNEGAIDALMMSFAVNTSLHSDEILLMIFGDGFQFNHTKDEALKRIPTYNSPGIVFSTGKHSVAAINQFYPRAYEAKLIADGVVTSRTSPRLFSRVGQKAIISESVVREPRYDEYAKLFKNVLSKRSYTPEQIDALLYGDGTHAEPGSGSVMDTWANIKDADGQGYVSLDYYRMLKANENNWTNAQELLYQKEIKGEYISAEEIFDAFPVYKLQYAGALATEGTMYPIQSIDKFSLLPLIPSLVKDTPLDTIHKQMISQGVDYMLFDSGAKRSYIKAGKTNGDSIFGQGIHGSDTSKLNPNFKFTANPFYLDFLKNQTEVNKIFKGKATLSTQFRKIFDAALYQHGVPIDYTGGKVKWDVLTKAQKMAASPIHTNTEAVLDELKKLTTYMRKDLIKELGWKETADGKLEGNLATMLTYIKGKLREQDYSEHEIRAIETDDGKIDLSTSPIAPRLERFLFSIINKKLVRLKLKGEAFVQGSAAFTKPTTAQTDEYDDFSVNGLSGYVVDPDGKVNTKGVRVKIALTKNYENLYQASYYALNKTGAYEKTNQTIAVYNKDLSINQEASFKRLNEMIKNDAWLADDNNREKLEITGVRIPVQGPNSTEFAQVWEFLPASAGPIIIIPAGIVAKSGGDFDVDKLTMYIKYISKRGTLLLDNVNAPEDLDTKIKALETKLDSLKQGDLNIDNSLEDFKKAVTDIQGYVTMSNEQLKAFTDTDNKALLKTLENAENQEYLKEVAPDAYTIYTKKIKSFDVNNYDKVQDTLKKLAADNSDLGKLCKELSDLKEHKRQFTAAIQNSMLGNLIKVLAMPEMAFSLLLPNGTYLTKPYADKLQDTLRKVDNEVDYNKSINTGEKIPGRRKGVSPSSLRDYSYNLKKQQDFTTGKEILGPIVLEIPVNTQLNKAGAFLNSEIEEDISIKKVRNKVKTPVTLELRHNSENFGTAAKEVRRISMSSLLDVDKQNQIADVLSQLANGAVDVGKDAWIAYLQGNIEAIPKILFLLETGVPIAEIAYFVNNPLIREYVATRLEAKSKLAKLFFGVTHSGSQMISNYLDDKLREVKKLDLDAGFNMSSLWGKYNLMKSFINKTGVEAFDKETLKKVAEGHGTENEKMAGLLQYLYVEQLTGYHDKLKGAIDVDNKTTGDNAEVQAKLEQINDAKDLPIYDPSTMDYLENHSIISSFFIQDLAADLFGERLFAFRANPTLDKFIRDTQKNWEMMGLLKKLTGLTKETFASKFKNALTLHVFSNAIAQFDPKATMYKGHSISGLLTGSTLSTEKALDDFKNKKYLKRNLSNDGYFQRGLTPINETYLRDYTANDFLKLTLEREYLRKHIMPFDTVKKSIEFQATLKRFEKQLDPELIIDNWSGLTQEAKDKIVYEYMLLHQALLNTYNNHEMFSSGENTVAKKLVDIIRNYPDLTYKYRNLLDRFTLDALPSTDKLDPRRNFKLKANSDISKPEAEDYFNKWKELADPSIHKLDGTTPKEIAANRYISDFFAKLPIISFLQSGMDTGQFSMNNVMPLDNFKPIIDKATAEFNKNILSTQGRTNEVLIKFFGLFLANNNTGLADLKGRGLNYRKELYEANPITKAKDITKVEVEAIAEANTIKQETETPVVKPAKLINDTDLANFAKFMTTQKGVLPKEILIANKESKWLLNSSNLYDLVDKITGQTYIKNVSFETGYQEGPLEETVVTPVETTPAIISMAELVNHSGGAYGADTYWDLIGREFGVTKHFHYREASNAKLSKSLQDKGVVAVTITPEQLEEGYAELERVTGKTYERTLVNNLKARNFFQVKNADSVFAIATLDVNKDFDATAVFGGTNAAVQMAIAAGKPTYVWDTNTKAWYVWDGTKFAKTDTPVLTKNFAGIGTRDIQNYSVMKDGKWVSRPEYKGAALEAAAKQAIRDVYTKTAESVSKTTPIKAGDLSIFTATQNGTNYAFSVENGVPINGQYKQGSGEWKDLNPKNVQSKYKELLSLSKTEEKSEEKTTVPHDKKYELFPGVYANEGQRVAIDKITEFLKGKDDQFLLKGRGGTGKTTIIKKALSNLSKNDVIGATVAYEAKEVLQENMPGYKTATIASLLGLVADYDPTNGQVYFRERDAQEEAAFRRAGKTDPIESKNYIIIDEASMVSDFLYNMILEKKHPKAKVIFMGDNVQIPPIPEKGTTQSKDSPVWKLTGTKDFAEITERMRQGAESPILPITDVYAENVENMQNGRTSIENPLTQRVTKFENKEGVLFLTNRDTLINDFINDIKDTDNVKEAVIVGARNSVVDAANDTIRQKLFNTDKAFVEGDFIRVNSPYVVDGAVEIPNGFKGKVTSVRESGTSIPGMDLKVYELTVSYTKINSEGQPVKSKKTFKTINPKEKNKLKTVLSELAIKAKGFAKGTMQSKKAWREFFDLKGSIVDTGYGYAITAHKVQGSTYNSTYVLESDIMNFPGGNEQKNRMMYTAVSRPKKKLVIYNPTQTITKPGEEEVKEPFKSLEPQTTPTVPKVETKLEKRKRIALQSLQDSIKNYRIDEVLAAKGYDVKDIISNLEAAQSDDDINQIVNKLRKLIC